MSMNVHTYLAAMWHGLRRMQVQCYKRGDRLLPQADRQDAAQEVF